MKRTQALSIIGVVGAVLLLAQGQPSAAQPGQIQLVLPSWVDPPKPPEAPARRPDAHREAQGEERTLDPQITFAALKLFRNNQRTMGVCDRIAVRRGVEPPARLSFLLRVDGAGGARVRVTAPGPLRPAVARCYRALAASWSYPSTGAPYTLVLSRITPRRAPD